jgi:hypothetical protein
MANSEHAYDNHLSRRAVLSGVGAAGLTAALVDPASALAAPPMTVAAAAAAVSPQSYTTGSQDFFPVESGTGYAVVNGANGRVGRGPVAAAGGRFVGLLKPPAGARGTKVAVHAQVPAGGSVPVRVEKVDPATGAVTVLASATLAVSGYQVATLTIDHTMNTRDGLRVAADLAQGAAVFGAELTYDPPQSRLFLPVTPRRRYDSRKADGPLVPGGDRPISYSDAPANASAVVVNVTVANTTGAGYLVVYAGGTEFPGVSTVNWWAANQAIANSTTVSLLASRVIRVRLFGTRANFFIDDLGYHLSA